MNVYKDTKKKVVVIDKDVPLPMRDKLFWRSSQHKTLTQNFIGKYIFEKTEEIWQDVEIVCNTTIESPCQYSSSNSGTLNMLQRNDIEENKWRIIF